MLNHERIELHESAIRYRRECIEEIEGGNLRHYCEGPTGRLDEDDTARMLWVFRKQIETEESCMAVLGLLAQPQFSALKPR